MQYYNVHSHIFTMNNAPKDFLKLYLPSFAATAVDSISNTQVGSSILQRILKFTGNGGKRYADFLRIGKSKNQREVFLDLLKAYHTDPNMKFVALTMNMEFCGAGSSATFFEGQLEEAFQVKKEFPDRLLLFMGIDPRWKSTGTELRRYVQRYFDTKLYVNELRSVYPFCGLKLYPSTGFYAFDEKLKETYKWAADNGVPVLSHCNYLGGIYNNSKQAIEDHLNTVNVFSPGAQPVRKFYNDKKFFKQLLGTNASRNNKFTCSYFLDPATYGPVLDYYKTNLDKVSGAPMPLKICLAHFGGSDQMFVDIDKKGDAEQLNPITVGTPANWYMQIKNLLTTYKGAYADISYAVYEQKLFNEFAKQADDPIYGSRVLFGTDYFLTEKEDPQETIYTRFKNFASNQAMNNYSGSLWDNIAGKNVSVFLDSKYKDWK
jgi:predicted TIM-barrel fold metal-dependent hydrolase